MRWISVAIAASIGGRPVRFGEGTSWDGSPKYSDIVTEDKQFDILAAE
jgi:hypothetical protein